MTIFQRIAKGEIPARIVRQDEHVLAFHDINPQAPVHILVVPQQVIARMGEAADSDADTLGRLLLAARDIAKEQGLDRSGYRLVINHGPDAGESVPHLHMHLLGGRPMAWPPG